MDKTLKEDIETVLDAEETRIRQSLDSLLHYIFWKDYQGPRIDIKDFSRFWQVVNSAKWSGPTDGRSVDYDPKVFLAMANDIRAKIGLPQLILDDCGMIREKPNVNS